MIQYHIFRQKAPLKLYMDYNQNHHNCALQLCSLNLMQLVFVFVKLL